LSPIEVDKKVSSESEGSNESHAVRVRFIGFCVGMTKWDE